MTTDQMLILGILAGTMVLFISGRLRHDIVATLALLALFLAGLLPAAEAFSGFAEPAVITVACVLVLSSALQSTGAIEYISRRILPSEGGVIAGLGALLALGAVLSAFMNNVGAMALLMPIALRLARRLDIAAGKVLMPLAFATMLGGMVTLIGTPPNLIVSGQRAEAGLGTFKMFDFALVGLPVALAGIAYLLLLGWRIVPAREGSQGSDIPTGAYLTEVRVSETSGLVGDTLQEAEAELAKSGAQIVGLVRNEVRLNMPRASRRIVAGDVLVVEADLEALTASLSGLGLTLGEIPDTAKPDDPPAEAAQIIHGRAPDMELAAEAIPTSEPAEDDAKADAKDDSAPRDRDLEVREFAVRPGSMLIGESPAGMGLRARHHVNVLAVSRSGKIHAARLRRTRIAAGDLLLVQGEPDDLGEFSSSTGSVALAERSMSIPDRKRAIASVAIMVVAVALTALGLLPASIAFTGGVAATAILRTIPVRQLYNSIDWPVIVLLGALMPVAAAMEATGAATLVAETLVGRFAQGNALVALALVLVVTMVLSDVMNNAATAAVMCPIAIGIAAALDADPDSFLMAVAIGASCAFLTPIGHQNNTLILGPGGFRFGDYWKTGLLMEIVVFAVAMVLLPMMWPL